MPDIANKRVQLIERVGPKQSDGDDVFRVHPWQLVTVGNQTFYEPVDLPADGIYLETDKEITGFLVIDGQSHMIPGAGTRTGGNVGLRRG